MFHGKTIFLLALTAATALTLADVATSQTSRPAGGPTTGVGLTVTDPEAFKAAMEKFRQAQSKQDQQLLGSTDEEWKVLGPKIEKVRKLKADSRAAAAVGYPDGYPEELIPAVNKTANDLAKVLKSKDAKPEDVKAALEAYHKAKVKLKEDLAKARKELTELLTVRQEAQLVLMSVLD